MSSERIQRRIERLLDLAKAAAEQSDWEESRRLTDDVLALDPENADAQAYIVSERHLRIESLLIQAQAAAERSDWGESRQAAELVLAMDPDNAIAQSYVLRAGQGTIEHLLDRVEEAADLRDWDQVRLFAGDILALDPDNVDAQTYNAAAYRVIDNISDEPQRGHYEIVVDSSAGVATVRGEKLFSVPVAQRTRYQRQEFAILEGLYRNRGRALSFKQILDECSSVFFFDSPDRAKDTIHRCIISLRMRIETDPSNPKIIRDVGDRSATSPDWLDRYMVAPSLVQTATVLDTGDISLPKLPEETNQELDQVTAVDPTGQEEQDERQTRPAEGSRRSRSQVFVEGADDEAMARTTTPIRNTHPEVVDQEPEHTIGVGQTEGYRKPPKRTEGWGTLKRILLIAVVGLIFGIVGQFIAIFIGVAGTPASAVLVLPGYIIGGIIGNKLYDQGGG